MLITNKLKNRLNIDYLDEFNAFVQNLKCGVFIRYTMESVLQDMHGKQLMCECLYLYGTMLLLLEHHIPGHIRERIVIAVVRNCGENSLDRFEDVSKLIRSTGYAREPSPRATQGNVSFSKI